MRGLSSRLSVLDDIGDRNAKRGTEAWAKFALVRTKAALKEIESDAQSLSDFLKELEKYSAWKVLGYASFGLMCHKELKLDDHAVNAFKTARPGAKVSDALAVAEMARSAKPLGNNGRPKKGTNIVPLSKGGNDRNVARIARDRPDILRVKKDAEFKSVRAADIKEGIVKATTPLVDMKRAWKKATKREKEEFMKWLAAEEHTESE